MDFNTIKMNRDPKKSLSSKLTEGYLISNGKIYREDLSRYWDDVPIQELGMSVRSTNALMRTGLRMLSDVLLLSVEKLKNIKNLGEKSFEETVAVVFSYFETDRDTSVLSAEKKTEEKDAELLTKDPTIDMIPLSVRAANAIAKCGYRYVSEIANFTNDDFLQIKNMGELSAQETYEKVQLFLKEYRKKLALQAITPNQKAELVDSAPKVIAVLEVFQKECERCGSIKLVRTCERLILSAKANDVLLLYAVNEITDVYRLPSVIEATNKSVIDLLEQHRIEGVSLHEIKSVLPESLTDELLTERLNVLAEKGVIRYADNYFLSYPSFADVLKTYKDERSVQVINLRIEGTTLEEIAQIQGGLTRERVRQIEAKCMRRLFTEYGKLDEDKYEYIYTTYDLNNELMERYLGFSKETVYFLEYKYKGTNKKQPVDERVLDDPLIPVSVKKRIEKYILSQKIRIGNEYVEAKRHLVEDALFPIFCNDTVSCSEFIEKYNEFVKENQRPELLIAQDNIRTRINKYASSHKILWTLNQKMRYYDVEAINKAAFLERLNLKQYKNVEISAKIIFDENIELMEELDIRNEYELHNLFKKILVPSDCPGLELGRTPIMQFGAADRKRQVVDLLAQLTPIFQNDFADAYSELYGVSPTTVLANYLSYVKQYINKDRILEMDIPAFSDKQIVVLKSVLTNDFYSTRTITAIIRKEYPDESPDFINHFTLHQLGFRVYSGYVIRMTYRSSQDYFTSILTSPGIIDTNSFSHEMTNLPAYRSTLADLLSDYDLIEFMPKKYICMSRLAELFEMTKEDIKAFCRRVRDFTDKQFFTVQSLKKDGFDDELFELGFDDYFYSSILFFDRENFAHLRAGCNTLFKLDTHSFSLSDFIEWLLYREESMSMDAYELIEFLNETYGLKYDRWDIKQKFLPGTSMYYSDITEKLYADYEIYFDEI